MTLDAAGVDIDDPFLGVMDPVGEQRSEALDDLGQQGVGPMKVMQMT